MPKLIIYIALILLTLAMVPPAIIARARTAKTDQRRIHFIQDMDNQARFRAQHTNPLFADGRAMRPTVDGTVARGELGTDDHYERGVVGDGWATTFPPQTPVTMELLERGREQFGIFCAPCHGQAGYGDGPVHVRAMELMNNPAIGNGTVWVQPKSVHDPEIRTQPVGQTYNTITNGVRTMSGYGPQILTDDRWAITAYVEALRRSQHARRGDLTPAERDGLDVVDLLPVVEEGN